MPLHKPIDSVEERDLQLLVENEESEGQYLEYKQALPGTGSEAMKELLADISSFANASGGDIIFGISEQRDEDNKNTGRPKSLDGLDSSNIDYEKLRLEQVIQSGIKPRIPGVALREVPLSNGKYAIVVRIPRSWYPPHAVDYQGRFRFYGRHSAGKYELAVEDIKGLVLQSETGSERIRNFRIERIAKIEADETPVKLPPGAKNDPPFGSDRGIRDRKARRRE